MDAMTPRRGARGAARGLTAALLIGLLIPAAPASEGHFVSVYGARHSPDRLLDIIQLRAATSGDARLAAIAWGMPLARGERTRVELEGQFARHSGLQSHWELNAVAALRWMDFPWDRHVDTRLAVGNGLSYASEVPVLEPGGEIDEDEQSNQWLNYVLVEAELKPPGPTRWSGFVRVHHRSGIFGAFGGVSGGSNFVGLGLRYYLGQQRAPAPALGTRAGQSPTEPP